MNIKSPVYTKRYIKIDISLAYKYMRDLKKNEETERYEETKRYAAR